MLFKRLTVLALAEDDQDVSMCVINDVDVQWEDGFGQKLVASQNGKIVERFSTYDDNPIRITATGLHIEGLLEEKYWGKFPSKYGTWVLEN